MPINFIPNDPLCVSDLPMRSGVKPRANRPAGRAGFDFRGALAEIEALPETPDFLFWQCREAALLTVEVWEQLDGPLKSWSQMAANPAKLTVDFDLREELNAFYDRRGLKFFHHKKGKKTTFSGASTDVVAHECGHALLDTIRPQLFNVHQTEFGAFHESFGDCMALLVALSDQECRKVLLQKTPDLSKPNFAEALMEDLADGVRRFVGPSNPSSAPRRALNKFQFQLPTALPPIAPPNLLAAQEHSFSRLFTGCFYDLIRGLFLAAPQQDEQALRQASVTAGKLLIAGARQAPINSRFFQSVGRAMVLADDTLNAGANRSIVGQAFAGHGIMLGSSAALMPVASLAGDAPTVGARGGAASVAAATAGDLKRRLGAAPAARLSFEAVSFGKQKLVQAVHQRTVQLGRLSPKLKGVVAVVPETAIVGRSGGAAAVMGALPNPSTTEDEVMSFVGSLLASGRLAGMDGGGTRPAASAIALGAPRTTEDETATHAIVTERGKRVLQRIRFACGCPVRTR